MFSLDDYRSKKNEILNDDKLSQKGKDDALAKLEQKSKDSARQKISDLRKKAVQSALVLRDAQKERFTAAGQAVGNLDYARLLYESFAVSSNIKASETIFDVESHWESVKGSDDVYKLKAWKETSQGLISEKFGSDDIMGQGSKLFEDIDSAKIEVETGQKSLDEIKALDDLREIESQAREIDDAFGQGQAVLTRVFDKISFEGDAVKLGFDYEIHKITDKPETGLEVARRLEIERDKAFEVYQGEMSKRGYEIDKDFDDLDGAFENEQ